MAQRTGKADCWEATSGGTDPTGQAGTREEVEKSLVSLLPPLCPTNQDNLKTIECHGNLNPGCASFTQWSLRLIFAEG